MSRGIYSRVLAVNLTPKPRYTGADFLETAREAGRGVQQFACVGVAGIV